MGGEKRSRSRSAGAAGKQAKTSGAADGLELAPDEFMVSLKIPEGTKLGLDVDWKDGRTLYIKKVLPGAVSEYNKDRKDETIVAGDRIIAINGQFDDPKAMLNQVKTTKKLELLIRTTRDLAKVSPAAAAAVAKAAAAAAELERSREAAAKAKAAAEEAARAKAKEKERAERRAAAAAAEAKAEEARAEAARLEAARLRRDFIATMDMTSQNTLGVEVDWGDGRSLYIRSAHGGAVAEWNRARPVDFNVTPGSRILAVNGYSDNAETMASLCRELIAAQAMLQLRIRGPPLPPEKGQEVDSVGSSDEEKAKREKKAKAKDKEKEKSKEKDKEKDKDKKKDKDKDKEREKDDKEEKDKEKKKDKKKDKKEKDK